MEYDDFSEKKSDKQHSTNQQSLDSTIIEEDDFDEEKNTRWHINDADQKSFGDTDKEDWADFEDDPPRGNLTPNSNKQNVGTADYKGGNTHLSLKEADNIVDKKKKR